MPRRIVRSMFQLVFATVLVVSLMIYLDERYDVLPTAIHNHLPAHHPGLVITDVNIKTCSSLNPLSSCQLDPNEWHRIEKDLLLGKGWVTRSYLHVKRKQEEELKEGDKVVLDVKISNSYPGSAEKLKTGQKWDARAGGIWVLRSSRRHESDSANAITAIDVLFGADAVDPRTGWSVKDTPLFIGSLNGVPEARLTLRRGTPHNVEKPIPRIRKDGKFKIMQAADLHLSTGLGVCRDPEPPELNGGKCDADPRTLDFVGKLLDQEQPDLVILSGDQVNGETAPDVETAMYKFAEMFVRRKIPYAAIFGNHDDEGSMSRAAQMSILETLPYSLSEAGPSMVDGVGNYVVEVLAPHTHHSALTLYLLDTHSYSPNERKYHGYDWLKENQIQWFKDEASSRKRKHKEYSKIHMDMAFIHIPIPEYADAGNKIVGQAPEGVTAPAINMGFKDALVEENVLFVSCGHDHANDYCSLETNKLTDKPALWMCYGGGAGFGGYGGYGGYHRRIRFFDIDANMARITTYKRLEYGDTEHRLDEQVIVDQGHLVA